ncbi:MAG: thiamine phosphate synthase [Hyphomicrobium sp.]|nr:thiamine phosphate synthase [Hyphomicrobiaceae bacterium]MCK5495242.1 thiamine phosphate synthase [Hyphomicrobiaceae bacterium]
MAREDQPRLCIVAEAAIGEDVLRRVSVVLESADIAVLFIAPAGATPPDAVSAKPLVDAAQAKGVAALIEGDAQLARTLRADGVHLPWTKEVAKYYSDARQIMGNRFIVGGDVGRSRHDAMSLCETGADYVGFGIPGHVEDRETARARQMALIEWWSDIFEVPCVAFDVETPQEAVALAHVGADFVVLAIPAGLAIEELARWAQDLAGALTAREAAA